ncbi:threonine synthase [Cardiobacterium sp. Marseille-Q4385]|uniref:threonine synthase n=1 Tax=Cardiobacterium sp. Marseille-Q4385 TaxID=2866573 RepID=UPI001CE43B4D|nr:threonine synthase [Cardiobacterium sp. Marseille-Q4385]
MQYQSTRGAKLGGFCDILLQGLAPDGGLAMPSKIPHISGKTLESWRELDYADLAYAVMHPFIGDIPEDDLRAILRRTYTRDAFGSADITPLTRLGDSNTYLLELSNGPSLAFKDIAMQFLGNAMAYVLETRDARLNILGATSGDTGSAAEYAMRGKERINVFMLSPHGRMSLFQQAQMYSLQDKNIHNIAIEGVFDDCQDLVKAVNSDAAYKAAHHIGAVNSINWARVLAQSVYYFKAWLALDLPAGSAVDFCVPSGNFGNIYAGYLAKQMGLPIAHLIIATNENDVLYEALQTGHYRARPAIEVEKTSSPSMDIGKASNFERYLYNLSGNNAAQTAARWKALAADGAIDLQPLMDAIRASGFTAGRSDHAARLATIRETYQAYNRLIDPHTADGVYVAKHWRAENKSERPLICLETALPAKFEATVREATGLRAPRPAQFEEIEEAPRRVTVMANDVSALKDYITAALA